MGAMVVALGFAVLFQFIILRVKFNKGLYSDIAVDVGMLVILNTVFGGSILGVVSATAGSTLISLYLMWKPIILFRDFIFTNKGDSTSPNGQQAVNNLAARFDSIFTKE